MGTNRPGITRGVGAHDIKMARPAYRSRGYNRTHIGPVHKKWCDDEDSDDNWNTKRSSELK
jgi:hypothetical protein